MPLQYLHTSAKRGLEPGKSGFCCVARDRDLPPDLLKELERLCSYERLPNHASPLVLRHLILSLHSGRYHVLSRIQDSGADYSKRNNHIAHHLAFSEEETRHLPDPATLLLFWSKWRHSWSEPPRILGDRDQFDIRDLDTNSEHGELEFEALVASGIAQPRALILQSGQEHDLALHYRNTLLNLPTSARWSVPFTNFILSSERPDLFVWSANWADRPLPFDFKARPSPVPQADPKQAEPTPAPRPRPNKPSRTAPTVEIPEELDRAARRRPKRKWTPKRLSHALNLGLLSLGILCLATVSYIIYNYKKTDLPNTSEAPSPSSPFPASTPLETDPRPLWEELRLANQLFEKSDQALALGKQLADHGDRRPLEIAQVLAGVKALVSQEATAFASIPVPSDLVIPENGHWRLNPTLASELKAQPLFLLPSELLPALQALASPREAKALTDGLLLDPFIPDNATIGLEALRHGAQELLAGHPPEAITAVKDYRSQRGSLIGDAEAEAFQSLERSLGLPANREFLGTDAEGRLLSPDQVDIASHLTRLCEEFILSRASSLAPSPEFRQALERLDQQALQPMEAAKRVDAVLAAARSANPSVESELSTTRDLWKQRFIRDDLMQQTIIQFHLERLASTKRALAQLQAGFSLDTLKAVNAYAALSDTLDQAEQGLAQLGPQGPWVLALRKPPQE